MVMVERNILMFLQGILFRSNMVGEIDFIYLFIWGISSYNSENQLCRKVIS